MSEFKYANMDGLPLFSFKGVRQRSLVMPSLEAKTAIFSDAVAQRAKSVTNILPSSPKYSNVKDTDLFAKLRVKCMDQLDVPS